MGLPFMAVHGIHGTDYEKVREDFLRIRDPYSGKMIFVVPAIKPDFCLIHAVKSDSYGNLIVHASEAHRLAALSATTTIASTEEIVKEDGFLARRGQTFLSALHVDWVVHLPLGAHPTSCPGIYPIDEDHVNRYIEHAGNDEKFREYLARYVMGMKEEEYIEKVGKDFFSNAFS